MRSRRRNGIELMSPRDNVRNGIVFADNLCNGYFALIIVCYIKQVRLMAVDGIPLKSVQKDSPRTLLIRTEIIVVTFSSAHSFKIKINLLNIYIQYLIYTSN